LNRIAAATHCYVKTVDPRNLTTLAPSDDPLSSDERKSLDNLVSYMSSKGERTPDDRSFRLWNNYRVENAKQVAEAIEYREGGDNVISIDEWRRRDEERRLF
jgi:hypothetical protein